MIFDLPLDPTRFFSTRTHLLKRALGLGREYAMKSYIPPIGTRYFPHDPFQSAVIYSLHPSSFPHSLSLSSSQFLSNPPFPSSILVRTFSFLPTQIERERGRKRQNRPGRYISRPFTRDYHSFPLSLLILPIPYHLP